MCHACGWPHYTSEPCPKRVMIRHDLKFCFCHQLTPPDARGVFAYATRAQVLLAPPYAQGVCAYAKGNSYLLNMHTKALDSAAVSCLGKALQVHCSWQRIHKWATAATGSSSGANHPCPFPKLASLSEKPPRVFCTSSEVLVYDFASPAMVLALILPASAISSTHSD